MEFWRIATWFQRIMLIALTLEAATCVVAMVWAVTQEIKFRREAGLGRGRKK